MKRSDKKRQLRGIPNPKKQEPQPEKAAPGVNPERKVAGVMQIIVYDNLDVDVQDFPTDHGVAMMALCNAMMKVSAWFLKKAANPSPIQIAKPGASMAEIEKMIKNN